MDQLAALRVFREVVEAGSFALAASRLSISAPMASKRVAQLEGIVNARLLHRSSRHLSLTEAGTVFYEQCRHALDILDVASAEIRQSAQKVRGHVKVSAPVWCANAKFTQILASYCKRYPEVVLDMHLANRKVDLAAEGYDLALRCTHEPSPALIARPLCRIRFHMVATPEFNRRLPLPVKGAEPPIVDAIMPSYVDLNALSSKSPRTALKVRLHPVMHSDDTTLTRHAALAGIGAAFLPDWLVAEDLASKRLVRIVADDAPAHMNVLYAVYVSRKFMAPPLRTFIDHLRDALGEASGAEKRPALAAPRSRPNTREPSALDL